MNNCKSQLSTKSLKKIAYALPAGGRNLIAQRLNIDKATVSRVLKGKQQNLDIINAAIELIEETKNQFINLENRIDQAVDDTKN